MNKGRLLMISTDRLVFDKHSAVHARQIEYAKEWDEVHIVVFSSRAQDSKDIKFQIPNTNFQTLSSNCFAYSTESFSRFMYPFDAIKLGCSIIKKHQITEITCQDASLTAMAGVSLKKKFNIPLEIQIHEDLGSPYYTHNIINRIRKILASRYLPRADKIRVVSERIRKYVESLLETRRGGVTSPTQEETSPLIEVRPIAVDIESIRNAPITVDLHKKYPQFRKIVLMASRLEKEKNIELAINAWPEVLRSVPAAGLIIVGKGSEKSRLQLLASKLLASSSQSQFPISNLLPLTSIIFEDWVDKFTLASYYKTADLFLVTSLFEGYGMTLVEAKTVGCKIVSTDVGVASEIGAIITKHDEHDLAVKIIQSLKS